MWEATKGLIFKIANHHLDLPFKWRLPLRARTLGESVLIPSGLPLLRHFFFFFFKLLLYELYKEIGLVALEWHLPFGPGWYPTVWFTWLWICLFSQIKSILKGQRLATIQDIQKSSSQTMQAIPKKGFQKCFKHWHRIWNKWIVSYGKKSSTLWMKSMLTKEKSGTLP